MSSMEAEYIAAAEVAMEAIWIRKFISGLGVVPSINKPMDMYCDNTGAITIADEPGVQKGAKHFQRKYHFIRELFKKVIFEFSKFILITTKLVLLQNQCLAPNMLSMLRALDLDQLDDTAKLICFSLDQGSPQPIINLGFPRIQETKPLFKIAGLQCDKYRGDKVKVILVLGEGHMARQCTQPKRPRNATWYKKKAMLVEAQEDGQISDEEQLAFLADPRVSDGQAIQTIIPNTAAF
ncbi:hypothetical protein Tco_1216707 [Tanacetum coccineum]